MPKIPKQKTISTHKVKPSNIKDITEDPKVRFSFESVNKTEYFNLDATCQNWSADLFDTLQKVSSITMKEIYSGKFSSKNTPFRIHQHSKADPPSKVPNNVSINDMWQIRISVSKGGIHGIFVDNIFYIIWFDPHHNLYPDKNHGGLKKIKPPVSCCKDREEIIDSLSEQLLASKEEVSIWENYASNLESKLKTKNNTSSE